MTNARILVVDDENDIRELVREILSEEGYTVETAGNAAEARAACAQQAPDLVLLDIGLPGMSGIEAVRRLSETHPELQILMLTVYADNEHVFEAICAGASGYLLKDTPPERLVSAIRELAAGGAPMSPEVAR